MRVKSGRFERVMEITLHNTDKCMKLKPIWAFACNFSPQAYFYLLLRYFSYFVFLRWSTRYMCLWVLSSVCFKNQQPNMNLNDHLGNMDTRCSCLCKSLKQSAREIWILIIPSRSCADQRPGKREVYPIKLQPCARFITPKNVQATSANHPKW